MFSAKLSARQREIFRILVEGHIQTGQPVGSEWVAAELADPVSPATVRNELLELEHIGLVRQPHTSAGRVPTEEGYRAYIELFARPQSVTRETRALEEELHAAETPEEKIRHAARELSALAGNIVMVGLDPRSVYAVGMGHMYDAPEARDAQVMRNISYALDRADELLDELFLAARDSSGVQILIGKENPIDESCSLMVTRVATSEGEKIMALLGFMRMRYDRNLALLQAMKKLIEQGL